MSLFFESLLAYASNISTCSVIHFYSELGFMKCCCFADEIAKLFPHLFGQPSARVVPADVSTFEAGRKLNVGVVLSGGQAPGGHNVICGIYGTFCSLSMSLSVYFSA